AAGGSDAFLVRLTQERGAILGQARRADGDGGQVAVAGRTVYLDQDNNGQFDAGEASTTTNAQGYYEFSHLPAGPYTVRQVLPAGWTQSSPAGGGNAVTLAAGQFVTDRDFVSSASTQAVTFTNNSTLNVPSTGTVTSTLAIADPRKILD